MEHFTFHDKEASSHNTTHSLSPNTGAGGDCPDAREEECECGRRQSSALALSPLTRWAGAGAGVSVSQAARAVVCLEINAFMAVFLKTFYRSILTNGFLTFNAFVYVPQFHPAILFHLFNSRGFDF